MDQQLRHGHATDTSRDATIDDDGVDLTLVRSTLAQTPTERLRAVESYMRTMATVRVVRRAGGGSTSA